MARIIMKSPYMKPGSKGKHIGNYVRYIATREGVELVEDTRRNLAGLKNSTIYGMSSGKMSCIPTQTTSQNGSPWSRIRSSNPSETR